MTGCCEVDMAESNEVYKILAGTPEQVEAQINRIAFGNWVEMKGFTSNGESSVSACISFYPKKKAKEEFEESMDG